MRMIPYALPTVGVTGSHQNEGEREKNCQVVLTKMKRDGKRSVRRIDLIPIFGDNFSFREERSKKEIYIEGHSIDKYRGYNNIMPYGSRIGLGLEVPQKKIDKGKKLPDLFRLIFFNVRSSIEERESLEGIRPSIDCSFPTYTPVSNYLLILSPPYRRVYRISPFFDKTPNTHKRPNGFYCAATTSRKLKPSQRSRLSHWRPFFHVVVGAAAAIMIMRQIKACKISLLRHKYIGSLHKTLPAYIYNFQRGES